MSDAVSKPKCTLIGEDGNVFNLAGIVSRTLRKAGMRDKVEEFQNRLFKCGSYDEALVLMQDYVEIK